MQMNIEQVPKPCDVDADPALTWGRLTLGRKRANRALLRSTGALMTACWQEEFRGNTGSPTRSRGQQLSNQPSVRKGLGQMGWRKGPYDRRDGVMPEEERDLGSGKVSKEVKARRLA
jgi:hypothetical protein